MSVRSTMTNLSARILALCVAFALVPGDAFSYAVDPPAPPPSPDHASVLTTDQLENLVAPIALYPDELLSQILVASTYPLQIVQAKQWLDQHPELSGEHLISAAQKLNWDPSVQALTAFPDVLKRLDKDISWTTTLGNTFLARQPDVMDAAQRLRAKAEAQGKLHSTSQETVTSKTESGQTTVAIEPADPEVMYVPDYDPAWIWGPALWYPYPYWDYPAYPGVDFCLFGPPILFDAFFGVSWGFGFGSGWGWCPRWNHRGVFVNHGFFHHFGFAGGSRFGAFGGRSDWHHDFGRRGFGGAVRAHPSVGQVQAGLRSSGTRVRAYGGMGRFGGWAGGGRGWGSRAMGTGQRWRGASSGWGGRSARGASSYGGWGGHVSGYGRSGQSFGGGSGAHFGGGGWSRGSGGWGGGHFGGGGWSGGSGGGHFGGGGGGHFGGGGGWGGGHR